MNGYRIETPCTFFFREELSLVDLTSQTQLLSVLKRRHKTY